MFTNHISVDDVDLKHLVIFHLITHLLNLGNCIVWLHTFRERKMEALWKIAFVNNQVSNPNP